MRQGLRCRRVDRAAPVERGTSRETMADSAAPRVSPRPTPGCASGRAWLPRVGGAAALFVFAATALAGPILVYRDGAYCPRELPADAPRITAAQAIARAKTLVPVGFCGPNWHVSGCDYDPEWAFDTWRVFVQQYQETGGAHDARGRDHTYIVLDAVGNCVANIPGT
jgi:hypothetical protein